MSLLNYTILKTKKNPERSQREKTPYCLDNTDGMDWTWETQPAKVDSRSKRQSQ